MRARCWEHPVEALRKLRAPHGSAAGASRFGADAAAVEKEIAALPVIGTTATSPALPEDSSAHAVDPLALAAKATAYQHKLAEDGQTISYSAAVRAVQEGKQ